VETKRNINAGQKARNADSTFAAGGVSCSADSFAADESAVLRTAFALKRLAHRRSAKRQRQAHRTEKTTN